MENKTYYDGTKLLSLKDINGNTPELYICTSNRSAGKTTYFGRLCVNRFFKYNEKFCLIYRYQYELDDCADKFYKDISGLFFPGTIMESKRRANGIFHELNIDGKPCGYAVSLNSADQLKKYSHLLSDVQRMIFDEFQSETNRYCTGEIKKFLSVHTSVARGQGKQIRYVPVFMISNPVSLINPYYTELGISSRLNDQVKFLRGDGFVLEQGFNQNASEAQKLSGVNRAFAKNEYTDYASEGVYLNDNAAFVENPEGRSRYIATLKYGGNNYAIREYADYGFMYCDDRPDNSFRFKITVTTEDHDINYVMLKNNSLFVSTMRYYFEKGCFRFKNLACKEALLKTISY
jgi:hypothetical protein